MLIDFETTLFQLKLTEMPSAHSFGKKCCFIETFLVFQPLVHSFGILAVLWKLAGKPLDWLLYPLGLALGSPIFPSGCEGEGKLGVALESLQGQARTLEWVAISFSNA